MIFVLAIMLMAVSADEADWIAVTPNDPIPINFKNSKLEVKTDYTVGKGAAMDILFLDGSYEKTVGWSVFMGDYNNGPSWSFNQCQDGGDMKIAESDLTAPTQVWTIWKRDGKLNVVLNGVTEVVKDRSPGDTEETKCNEDDDGMGFPDWEEKWGKEVIGVKFLLHLGQDTSSPTGYQIISEEEEDDTAEEEDDRQRLSSSATISLNSAILVATLPFWGF